MIKTLYLHENLNPNDERDSKWNEKYLLLEIRKDNTHLKFIQEVKFEENWCPIEKPLTEFNNESKPCDICGDEGHWNGRAYRCAMDR